MLVDSHTTIENIKKNLHILQQNQNFQRRQTLDQFVIINLAGDELGDHKKLLHTLDLTLIPLQHSYLGKFIYLKKSRNLMVPLTDINARLPSIQIHTN